MPLETLPLLLNIPKQIGLKNPEGQWTEGHYVPEMYYVLTDGEHCFTLELQDAAKLNALELERDETFWICKEWSGSKKQVPRLRFWRLEPGEKKIAEPQSESAPAKPVLSISGNGRRRPAKNVDQLKIPFDRAFREAVELVQRGLRETGEQWSDSARQDAVSTVLIAAVKEGWIGPWEQKVERMAG